MELNKSRLAQDNYEALLLNYAAGILDQAQSLIVATHLALSPRGRALVRDCEAIGGALIERQCDPVAMRTASLKSVLSRLETCAEEQKQKQSAVKLPDEVHIPQHLMDHVSCRPCQPKWKRLYSGLHMCELPLECNHSGARFIKARPAAKMPHHMHRGIEITLVLDGGYRDENGFYKRGDMTVLDEADEHALTACESEGVVTMVVSSAPIRLTGLARLLNPFIR